MRCEQCNYALWNLSARQCPECGTPFKPSERTLVVNAVQFCCPYCDQAYYGTSAKGHLEPATFECCGCQHTIDMDDMVLRPAKGVQESQTRETLPWLDPKRSWFARWFRTVGDSMTAPMNMMRQMPGSGATKSAWMFAALTGLVFSVVCLGSIGLLVGGIKLASGVTSGAAFIAGMAGFVGAAITVSIAWLIGLLVWSLVTHGVLRLTGGCDGTLGRTMAAICFGSGTTALGGIPCLGVYCSALGLIWHTVVACIMVMTAQRVSGARAALAVLLAPVIAIIVGVTGYFGLIIAMVAGQGPFAQLMTDAETADVTAAIVSYAQENESVGPAHAALLLNDNLMTHEVLLRNSATDLADVSLGDSTLGDVAQMPPGRRQVFLQGIAEAMPESVVAHRLGDFVFTYHGVDFDSTDPLWIVVAWPDGVTAPPRRATVGLVDGTTHQYTADEIGRELVTQNALRAQHNLPPLPAIETITHAQPAVSDP